MDQLGARRRIATCAVATLVTACAVVVVALRAANPGPEPQGQNWWLVCWLAMAMAYGTAGAALLGRPSRRGLAACFLTIGAAALVTAIAVQYRGYEVANGGRPPWSGLTDADDWARPLAAGVLAAFVPWQLLPPTWRHDRRAVIVRLAGGLGLGTVVLVGLVGGPAVVFHVGWWTVCAVATVGTATVVTRWWRHERATGDPLPGWMAAGAVVAWLAVVPDATDLADWRLPGRDVVTPLLFLSTIPLLVVGTTIELIRRWPGGREGVAHRVIEWTMLASGLVILYTALVAGLGLLVGGSGPTWFLVAATIVIALVLEPGRSRIRRLVDRLVYGSRDDPLGLVQHLVDHVGAGAEADILPSVVGTLGRELRVDEVAIDVPSAAGWERVASTGSPAPRQQVISLRHRDEVVGRLIIGWEHGPSLRRRDQDVLEQLVAPLTLAVRWVRLAGELRRSSVATVVAREEERRRLRRDLHDGLGPALTGVSLGLRTTIRRLARAQGDVDVRSAEVLLRRLADEVDTVVGELKQIVRGLRPTALDQLGLVGAVAEFARTIDDDLEIHLALPADPVQLPAAVEVATYRIVTEAVTNVVRHSHAERCWLTITAGGRVGIDVVDDGIGLDTGARSGVGLAAMRERAAELGGSVTLLPNLPHGTHVHVELPAVLA